MKLSLKNQPFLLLLPCIYCTDVIIKSSPSANEGVIQTEVEKTVTLSCVVEGSPEKEELQWYRNDRLVSLKEENSLQQSHLCVEQISTNDNGAVFTCQLKTNSTTKASILLEVYYAPDLNGSEEVRVAEGSDIALSCDVRAYPPVSVVWKKEDALLDLSSNSYHTSNNGITAQLSISNIKHYVHEGLYTCETSSSVYGKNSKTFSIIVEDKVMKFPLGPMIAGLVVVFLTILLALVSRRKKIMKCFKRTVLH
ncbi:transmembrane and immunoglobulin domain-containing protein 1 [Hoplias malabaricus]|uniref:transmembrane and immunoglobulin domain-containing protein 1 n=1 Tax=Hoplias malabaricus TaxID=27720 RepID=UPI0034632C7B